MRDLDSVAAAIRTAETNDDYRYQQAVDISGQPDRKIGAYGIVGSKWLGLAEAAGIPGADWNDRAAQDAIARRKLDSDYKQLGDWGMAAVAFRFGTSAATSLQEAGYTDPGSIEAAGYPEIAEYMRAVKRGSPSPDLPVSGSLTTGGSGDKPSPTLNRAEKIVRGQLLALRNQQRKEGVMQDGSDENVESGGDSGVPDPTE